MPTLYLAPMQGVMGHLFRNVYCSYFPDYDLVMAPYITTKKGRNYKNYQLKDILPENNQGVNIIPQIMSNGPEDFNFLAGYFINELGYKRVNWNLGCPYRTAVGKNRGAGLLSFPDRIRSFLEGVMREFPDRVSVKARLGHKTSEELFELMPVFNQYPLAEIIIHPRTGTQMYEGFPDRPAFGACLSISKHPVVYNGDITDTAVFIDLQQQFPRVNGWMIGRGAIADPFLAREIRGATPVSRPEKKSIIYNFIQELAAVYKKALSGPVHPADKLKGVWEYLHTSFEEGKRIFRQITKVKNIGEYQAVVGKVFEDCEWIK